MLIAETKRRRLTVLLPVAGLLLLIPPLYFTIRWAALVSGVAVPEHTDVVAIFRATLPPGLRTTANLSRFEFFCSLGALVLGIAGYRKLQSGWRVLGAAVALFAGMMLLSLAGSLM